MRATLDLITGCDREQKKLFELRSARLYAFGVCLSYGLLLVIERGREQASFLAQLTGDALGALTFIVGTLTALGAARGFARHAEWRPFTALAAQRGYSARDVARARLLASGYRCALLVGAPALALVVLAWLCGKTLAWALITSAAVCLYACLTGGALAGLAWLAAWLSPRRPRLTLLSLGLCPLLIALGFPWLPSVPGALSWALARLGALGAHFT